MSIISGPSARIILRYAIGIFVGAGVISYDLGAALTSDPDMQMVVEIAVSAVPPLLVEGWYLVAKKLGWKL